MVLYLKIIIHGKSFSLTQVILVVFNSIKKRYSIGLLNKLKI